MSMNSRIGTPMDSIFGSANKSARRNIMDLVSPKRNLEEELRKKREQQELKERIGKREELNHILGELISEKKLSKRRFASMILSTMRDHADVKSRKKAIKVLVRTFLKSGSLIPRTLDPEQILTL